MIYLDNAATTRIDPTVRQEMSEWENYANAGSIYAVGREARARVDKARAQVAQFLNCDEDQVIFTSGGSESNATVMRGFDVGHISTNIAYSAVEHESVRDNAEYACILKGAKRPHEIPVFLDTGATSVDLIEKILDGDESVGLVSVMTANNEIGSINDTCKIGELCDEYGVLFHTDCVQAVGTVPLDVKKIKCDFLSLSAHKFHGPKGVGVLYCRDRAFLRPLIAGSAQQEFGMRGGTENVTGIIGLGAAISAISDDFEAIKYEIMAIKRRFYEWLIQRQINEPSVTFKVNGLLPTDPEDHSKIISLTFDGVDAQSLVLLADAKGVCISAGSACNSRSTESSKVLRAIGLTDEEAHSTVRVSFSKFNTWDEAVRAADIIFDAAKQLMGGVQ